MATIYKDPSVIACVKASHMHFEQWCSDSVRCMNLPNIPNPEPEPQVWCKIFRTLNLHQRFRFTGSGSGFTRFKPGSADKIFLSKKCRQKSNEILTLHHFSAWLKNRWSPWPLGFHWFHWPRILWIIHNSTGHRAATYLWLVFCHFWIHKT